jgi:transcriptional regulator with XRE-family HTH domain
MATSYGNRLRQARKHADLTQEELSKKTGIPQSTISTAERMGNGSAETVTYAMACGVNPAWLATGEGEMLLAGSPVAHDDDLSALRTIYRAIDPVFRTSALQAATQAMISFLSPHPTASHDPDAQETKQSEARRSLPALSKTP